MEQNEEAESRGPSGPMPGSDSVPSAGAGPRTVYASIIIIIIIIII